ncbi:MAG TPA: AAA family ATPase [Dehalococcoidia bacterium]|nr:AAA family ATPase [Dehalococcoidia bacterium]
MRGPLPELIEALRSPTAYDHDAAGIELIQTHISYILLAGRFAYKIKKPVDLGFVDYLTLERRRFMCEEEVRLNRRLCAEVHLGVVPITRSDAGYRVDGAGDVVEYAVQMRRIPRDRMLPDLLAHNSVTRHHIRRIAGVIAGFHARAHGDNSIARYGRTEVLRLNWDENLAQAAPFVGATVTHEQQAAIAEYVTAFLGGQSALIEARADGGRTRDCHGDLRCDAIVLGEDDSVCIMDCIEFNDRLRFGDVAGDIGFLAMDLDARRRPDLADELMSAYLADVDDETLPCVLDFYRSYRAYVRGKVESMESDEPEVPASERALARERACAAFALAHGYARASRPPAVVLMLGLSGAGKSHIAAALSCRIGAALVRSDTMRRRLYEASGGAPPGMPAPAAYDRGAYAADVRARVYAEIHAAAEGHLAAGRPVLLDATYGRRSDRDSARRLAAQAGVPLLAVHIVSDEAVVRERLDRRARDPRAVSDARWETYLAQRRRFEPPDEIAPHQLLRLDGAADLHQNVGLALDAVARLSR